MRRTAQAPEDMRMADFTPSVSAGIERSASLADKVYVRLSGSLRFGECLPGQRLSARRLAKELDVSLTPVREAMLRLVSEGALQIGAKREFRAAKLDLDTYREVASIRLALEPLAAGLAAERISAPALEELDHLNECLADAIRAEEFGLAPAFDTQFHQSIYNAAGRPLLYSMIDNLLTRAGPTRTQLSHGYRRTLAGYERHKTVIDALRSRNARLTSDLIEEDLRLGTTALLEVLELSQEERSIV